MEQFKIMEETGCDFIEATRILDQRAKEQGKVVAFNGKIIDKKDIRNLPAYQYQPRRRSYR